MSFIIDVDEIREEGGLDYDRELPTAFLDEALKDSSSGEFHARGAGRIKGHFDKLPGRVLFKGRIELTLKAPCKRCLTECVEDDPIDLKMTWVHERPDVQAALEDAGLGDDGKDEDGPAKGSFTDGDVDTEPFDGETVQLDAMIREQVLLSLPMDVVCKESCKGLCSTCGQDLNERDCGHDQKVPDPRWAALKDIKLRN